MTREVRPVEGEEEASDRIHALLGGSGPCGRLGLELLPGEPKVTLGLVLGIDAVDQASRVALSTIPAVAEQAGCAQGDYAPEIWCPVAKLCCQDNLGGPFVDLNSGACAASSCP